MNRFEKTMWAAVLGTATWAVAAGAFPTWMGVFGVSPRHDGRNPGQFLVMMNEDYYGLEASVGIRVNGGDWTEHAMAYRTNSGGNSVWTYAPAEPFPFQAEIEFYFHGYDGSGSHLYDSADSANYHGGPLFWSAPADTGLLSAYPGNSYGSAKACTLGTDLVAGHASGVLTLGRKAAGCEWETLDYPLADAGIAEFGLAGNGDALLVVCVTNFGGALGARASADRGETFGASVALATAPANGTLAGVSAAAGGAPGEFGVAYGVSTNCCGAQQIFFRRTTDGGATWSAPVLALDAGGSGAFFSWLELGRNDAGWFLAARNVWQGSSLLMYCARSADAGGSWTMDNLGSSRAWGDPDLALATNVAMLAADPYYDDYVRTWRYQDGAWTTQDVARALEGGRAVRLSHDGHGRWFLFRAQDNVGGTLWSWFLSRDGGATWTTNRALANPPPANAANDVFTLLQAVGAGPKQYLLWQANYYVGTYQRTYEVQLSTSDGYAERLEGLSWAGDVVALAVANAAPGATNHLECAADLVAPVWTNLATWTSTSPATNWSGTVGKEAFFRIRVER